MTGRFERLDAYLRGCVERGELAGWQVAVTHEDALVHRSGFGLRSLEQRAPVCEDTIWRIYSMTKPITATAALMLWEEGAFDLADPLSAYLPEFAGARRFVESTSHDHIAAVTEPIRVGHLFTHTAGLTFAAAAEHPVDALYREAGLDWAGLQSLPLAIACRRIATMPLLFGPGAAWNYSVASDVLGRLVEVLSGQEFGAFVAERLLAPLRMNDTGFQVRPSEAGRLASLYLRDGGLTLQAAAGARILEEPTGCYGGAGLASTLDDYCRFARMLCNGGTVEGVRLLSRATMAFATANHLPGGAELGAFGRPILGEPFAAGIGFNLFGSVVIDPVAEKTPGTAGNYGWSGAAGSHFWVDPAQRLTCVFMTQTMARPAHPLRRRLKQLVYQALDDLA
ncbi:serine hydrolase domain-containing protein [uncultured Sphingomonas sp.]|uniref:serine hydrolase domain-containing protein n=1 Tax=uncultured Sphingomonas sp. TaxID=158754 RepID=UPI0035CC2BB1